jgi:hypothetical protein
MATKRQIAETYGHDSTLPEFEEGYHAYGTKSDDNPYTAPEQQVKAQAWDKGFECAMRVRLALPKGQG